MSGGQWTFGPIRVMRFTHLLLSFEVGRMLDAPGLWFQRGEWTVQLIAWPLARFR